MHTYIHACPYKIAHTHTHTHTVSAETSWEQANGLRPVLRQHTTQENLQTLRDQGQPQVHASAHLDHKVHLSSDAAGDAALSGDAAEKRGLTQGHKGLTQGKRGLIADAALSGEARAGGSADAGTGLIDGQSGAGTGLIDGQLERVERLIDGDKARAHQAQERVLQAQARIQVGPCLITTSHYYRLVLTAFPHSLFHASPQYLITTSHYY